MRRTQIGDYGKLDYRVEQEAPEIFRIGWHHNGIVKAVKQIDEKILLDIWFYNGNTAIDVPDGYFDNFTAKYGIEAPQEKVIHWEDLPENEVLKVARKAEEDFYQGDAL